MPLIFDTQQDSQRVAQSMAEIELAAKRRVASSKTRGRAGSGIGTNTDGEQDAAEHAANQVKYYFNTYRPPGSSFYSL